MATMFNTILMLSTPASHSLAAARPRVVRMQTSRVGHKLLDKRDHCSVTLGNAVSQDLYYVNASVGTPKQNIALQIDTGTNDIWVFGPGSYDARTSHCLGGYCTLIFPDLPFVVPSLTAACLGLTLSSCSVSSCSVSRLMLAVFRNSRSFSVVHHHRTRFGLQHSLSHVRLGGSWKLYC